ncbi:hypothetical protein CSAL01_02610 [Colletotrichum salicis]|uniref:Uncharacterized protein n=1 Tax=Colletotrichum salicis TaxID=1209931 RepID=A0A135UC39_9PEZI|nr:hypothetical protein CSAL01_02610 [Colletotrichum salicis]
MDAAPGRRRERGESQAAWIKRLRTTVSETDGVNEFDRLTQDAREAGTSSIGFSQASVLTQKRQDRILEDYRTFVRVFKKVPDGIAEKELDELCFPSPLEGEQPHNFDALWRLFRHYLSFVAESKIPRYNTHSLVSYSTLIQYLEAFQFWVAPKFGGRDIEPPSARHVFNQMTEMLRTLAIEMKVVRLNSGPSDQVRIVLDGIHSLSPSANEKVKTGKVIDELPFLAWEDCNLSAGNRRGSHPQQQANLALSAPHRLLVIGLRRGLFDGLSTIDDLFDSELDRIPIKAEFLHKPVLLVGNADGSGLNDDHSPMPAASLTKCIELRGERMGWPGQLTFYNIRRLTAATYVKALGDDHARMLMSHEPDSLILERFFIDRTPLTDASDITLGEETRSNKAEEFSQLEITSGVPLDKLPARRILKTRKKNRDRVLRRKALLVLRTDMTSLYQKQQTQAGRVIQGVELLGQATMFKRCLIESHADNNLDDNVMDLDTVDFDREFELDSADAEQTFAALLDVEGNADGRAGRSKDIIVPE